MLSLVVRELRAESRRPWLYWSRLAAGGLVTISFGLGTLPATWATISGTQLFHSASIVVLSLIWLIVPLLTADCLSGEKREGTLGLLFLTPLTAQGIVVGKSLVHAMRASTLILAAVPVIALTMLFGGVSGAAIMMMLMHFLGALSLALAAGLLASSWARDWLRAVSLTGCLTFLFAVCYYNGMRRVASSGSIRSAALLLILAVLALFFSTVWAAQRIRSTWQDGPPSRWFKWWSRTFCSPIFWKERLRQQLSRRLEQNPIVWLQDRAATARTCKWLWAGGATLCAGQLLTTPTSTLSYFGFQTALILGMGFTGAASFRRERQNGVLELLLVSPLPVEDILEGRIRAVRKQFAPAVGLVVVPYLLFLIWTGTDLVPQSAWATGCCAFLITSWAVLPAIGLYFSVLTRRFLTAWLLATLVGLVLPILLARMTSESYRSDSSWIWLSSILEAIVGAIAIKVLREKIRRGTLCPEHR